MGLTVTQGHLDTLSSIGSTLKINGVSAVVGDVSAVGDTWVIDTAANKILSPVGGWGGVSVRFSGNWSPSGTPAVNFVDAADLQSASLTWDSTEVAKNVFTLDINVVDYTPPEPIKYYTLTAADMDTLTQNTVELSVDGVVLGVGAELLEGQTVIATITGTRRFIEGTKGSVYLYADWSPSYPDSIKWNIVDDITASYEFGSQSVTVNPNWELGCSTELVTPEIVVPNNVYLIDNDILKEVNKKRFRFLQDQFVDYGQYIVSALNLPFNIPTEIIGGKSNIWLGDFDTEIVSDQLSVDHIKFDMGTIEFKSSDNNMFDYINTTINIKLPYSPDVELDVNDVVDKVIKIEYVLNVYTGNVVINIFSDGLNISSTSVNLGVKVPLINDQDFGIISNDGLYLGTDNGIRTPYLSINKSVPVLADGFYTSPVMDEDTLLNQTGYVVVEQIDLNVGTQNERIELINMLKDGVIIK